MEFYRCYQSLVNQMKNLSDQQSVIAYHIEEVNNAIKILHSNLENNSRERNVQNENLESRSKRMKKCGHFNRGYCRSKEDCPYLHPKNHCLQKECDEKRCKNRHIKDCTNWSNSVCRFGGLCEYKHDRLKKFNGTKNTTSVNKTNTRLSEEESDNTDQSIIEEVQSELLIEEEEMDDLIKEDESEQLIGEDWERYEVNDKIFDENDLSKSKIDENSRQNRVMKSSMIIKLMSLSKK